MGSSSQGWAEQGRYDLDTAHDMLAAGRYLYVLFCCQQAVEKTLKALIAERSQELPPRLHQLVRLAEVAQLKLTDDQVGLLRELSAYYIETRYPPEIPEALLRVKEAEARRVLAQSEEMLRWLNSML